MNDSPRPFLIGVAGTNGAGKDTVGDALKRHGFYVVAAREVIGEYARKNFHVSAEEAKERSVLSRAGNEMRDLQGPAAIVHVALDHFQEENNARYSGLVVTSIRTLAEAEAIQSQSGIIVYVDAPAELRWQRAHVRGRDKEAALPFEDFVANEQVELKGLTEGDPKTVMHIEAVGGMADLQLFNDKNGIEEFETQAYNELQRLMPATRRT